MHVFDEYVIALAQKAVIGSFLVLPECTEYRSTEVVDGAGNYLNTKNCCCIESQCHIFYCIFLCLQYKVTVTL